MADNKIALESEALTIGGGSGYADTNKACTKTRAEELNCEVKGNYASNQCVKYDDLDSAAVPLTGLQIWVSTNIYNPNRDYINANDALTGYTYDPEFFKNYSDVSNDYYIFDDKIYPFAGACSINATCTGTNEWTYNDVTGEQIGNYLVVKLPPY